MKLNLKALQNILNQAYSAVLVFESDSKKCVYANGMAKSLLNIEYPGAQITDLIPSEVPEGQRGFNSEIWQLNGLVEDVLVKSGDGLSLFANVGISHIDGNLIVLVVMDITFQKKLQRDVRTKQAEIFSVIEELQKQNKTLKDLDKAKDRFIALTSHELRTPISAIVATAQFIEDGLCNDTEELLGHVKVMLGEGKHLLEMVNDILDFSKIQMGKFDLYVGEHKLIELLQQDILNMEKFAGEKGVVICLEQMKNSPTVYCDQSRMAQVFYNVLSNAVKFSPKNSQVLISIEEAADHIRVAVHDYGKGIPKEHEGKVFNEFETIENIRTHHKGTGLGMPISKRLIECMGGKIYFESGDGKGTTFFIEIPTKKILNPEVYRARPDLSDFAA